MTNERIDALVRQLDVDATPDEDFVRRSLAVVSPLARSARVRDAGSFGGLLRRFQNVGVVPQWRMFPVLRGLAYLALLLAMILALVATFALFGHRSGPRPPQVRNGLIAYTTLVRGATGDDSFVHLINPDGTGDREIASGICPTLLAQDRLAYWPPHSGSSELTDLTIAPTQGSLDDSLHVQLYFGYQKLAVSPDGTTVVEFWKGARDRNTGTFHSGVFVAPIDGSTPTLIVQTPLAGGALPGYFAWSPDGRHIAFTALTRLGQGELFSFYRSALYVVSPDGSNLQLLSARPGTELGSIAWSPDSRLIAFTGVAGGSAQFRPQDWLMGLPALDVFVIRADGTGETNVTNSPADETAEVWSPDGSRLAFLSYDGATQAGNIASAEFPDSGSLNANPAIESGPLDLWTGLTWSPDGTLLIGYTSGGTMSVMRADMVGPPTRIVSRLATVDDDCGPSWQREEP